MCSHNSIKTTTGKNILTRSDEKNRSTILSTDETKTFYDHLPTWNIIKHFALHHKTNHPFQMADSDGKCKTFYDISLEDNHKIIWFVINWQQIDSWSLLEYVFPQLLWCKYYCCAWIESDVPNQNVILIIESTIIIFLCIESDEPNQNIIIIIQHRKRNLNILQKPLRNITLVFL